MTATIAKGLDVPWAIAFLPDGSALVTLRDKAQLLHVRAGRSPVVLGAIAGVRPDGEGGLLGVAVSPGFAKDSSIFVYYTAAEDNRVVRLTFADGKATKPTVVLRGIPKAGHHNGGRLAFGPDGFLYVTTGDAGASERSQDKDALGGKILRITRDGKPAPGNPFGDDSPVWSYGHRNVQGIAWAPDGTDVRERVRAEHLGRAQPHRAGSQLRVAGRGGPGGALGVHRPAGPVADVGRLTERDRRG